MKNISFFSLLILSVLILVSSCRDDEDTTPSIINPADANALTQALIMPAGTQRQNGTAPSPSTSANAPDVSNLVSDIMSSNGSTAPLSFFYSNINGGLGGCYVQIDGAGSYFTVPYTASLGNSGQLELPIGIPSNVDEGDFCVNFCIYDDNGLVSNVVNTCVSVIRLGTGAIQISLSWNNSSDQDLYVTDPNGETIYYSNTSSSSGGQLDRDDTSGYGPENIYWTEDAPDGAYKVSVNDYDYTFSPTTFYVTVSGPNTSKRFTGTTQYGSTADVVTFTKNGDNLSF